MKSYKFRGMTAAALIIVIALFLYLGDYNRRKPNTGGVEETPIQAVETTSEADLVPELEEDQAEILEGLAAAIKSRDFKTGGAMLLDHEQKLQYLFYQTLKGKQYLYRDGRLSQELEGEGLILKKPLSAFYGTFQEGDPEGEGAALQGIVLDGSRYDYADGNWQNGKLNGQGTVGYHYYKGVQGDESQAANRTGLFADDLMDGAFTYQTTSAEGEVTVWEMEAAQGITVLDERWIYDEENQYHYLPSQDISSHTYVLYDDMADEKQWRNMLTWEE